MMPLARPSLKYSFFGAENCEWHHELIALIDKRFVINAAAGENTRPLNLLLNWDAELKK